MSARGVALVLGATGVTGTPLTEHLLASGWCVYGLSRRPSGVQDGRYCHLLVDIHDKPALHNALRGCRDVTHVFDCASVGTGTARIEALANLLDGLEANAPDFRNINLQQGMKYYGCHLGPFATPAREDAPRLAGNLFYYADEDLIRRRQAGKPWTWTALRPHSVCGYADGNPLNLALVLAVYCSIRCELAEPLWFPASVRCFESQFQVMDASLLARAALYVATNRPCANNAFNLNNSECFRWRGLWPGVAAYFGLKAEGAGGEPLADFLTRHAGTWNALAARHGLRVFPIERAAAWVRGDYTAPNSRFAAEYDICTDTTKIRQAGFSDAVGNAAMFQRLFTWYRDNRVIP
ncbi:MAG TPA: SDR family oxidoreductase [Xanthobacteraceae bacterium]|nr:SDR family oxidoreductase [Xanthobacteraceae bacterium]